MSESLHIGQLITTEQHRDAIHVAVAPVVAHEFLEPGQHVGLCGCHENCVSASATEKIGVVDPFLADCPRKGQQFWLFLNPGSITSLRHDWTHPAFAKPFVPIPRDKAASEAWLREFCKSADCPGYETVIGAITNSIQNIGDEYYNCYYRIDDEYFHFNGSDAHSPIPPEFWEHVEIVTGVKCTLRPAYFSCSC